MQSNLGINIKSANTEELVKIVNASVQELKTRFEKQIRIADPFKEDNEVKQQKRKYHRKLRKDDSESVLEKKEDNEEIRIRRGSKKAQKIVETGTQQKQEEIGQTSSNNG